MRTLAIILALAANQPQPGPNTVKTSAIQNGAVTAAKLASGISVPVPTYTFAGLPSPDGNVRVAKITDHEKGIYYSNGSQWIPYDGGAFRLENFGGAADGITDNLTPWNNMKTVMGVTIGPEVDLGPGAYYFSDTPHVSRVENIVGKGGNYNNPLTIIRVPDGKDGMVFDYAADASGTAEHGKITGITIESLGPPPHWAAGHTYFVGAVIQPIYWGGLEWVATSCTTCISGGSQPAFTVRLDNLPDTDGDVVTDGGVTWTSKLVAGWRINASIYFTDASARYFGGDGFHVQQIAGAANDGSMRDCSSSNNMGNGFYFANANANAWSLNNIYAVENGTWGIRDRSFLGNHFFSPNTATNGYDVWLPSFNSGTFAGFNGVTGLVRPSQYVPNSGYVYQTDNPAHTTGTTEPTWCTSLGCTVSDGTTTWTAVAQWTGGSIQSTNVNAYTDIVAAYTELGEGPAELAVASSVEGGLIPIANPVQAGVYNARQANNVNVETNLPGTGKTLFHLGQPNPTTSVLRLWGIDAFDASDAEITGSQFDMSYWTSGYFPGMYALSHANAYQQTPYAISTGASPYMPAYGFALPNGFYWYGGAVSLNTFGTAPLSTCRQKGDHVMNYQPAIGEPIGWRCITAGTPGVWDTEYASGGSPITGITAHAGGGGVGTCTQLAAAPMNRVDTINTTGDSVCLPACVAGFDTVVANNQDNVAKALAIYPPTGGAIDALGANTPYSLAGIASLPSERAFRCIDGTNWISRP